MRQHQASDKPQLSAEHLVRAVAARHGFRVHDYALIWDEGEFDPSRPVHELAITMRDGRSATVEVQAEALGLGNPWLYFPRIETALATLRRRSSNRGADAGQ
jgi:hypothetical protein